MKRKTIDRMSASHKKPEVWAHRGASASAPENTMPAFLLALEQEADGIELDVQMTADKRLVVLHDERIDRVSDGSGFVKDLTIGELRRFNFNLQFPQYGRVELTTLEDVLDLILTSNMKLNIELKNNVILYPGLEEHVRKFVQYKGLEKQVIVSSFNHESLQLLGSLWPSVERGLLYSDGWLEVAAYAKRLGVSALHPPFWLLRDGELVQAAHEAGLKVHVWAANTREELLRCKVLGVDAVITNDPALGREVMDA